MRRINVHPTTGQWSTTLSTIPSHLRSNRDIHGFEGPIKVSFGNYTYPIMQDFLRAAESQGIPTTDDLQDLVTGQYVLIMNFSLNAC